MFRGLVEDFLNAISLRLCSSCSKAYADDYYCDFCMERLKFTWGKEGYSRKYLDFDFIELTQLLDLDLPLYPRIYTATKYDDATKALIRHFKYRKPFLSKFWARFLYDYWCLHANWILSELSFYELAQEREDLPEVSLDLYIVPVPMFEAKKKRRKYNQAELLARDFAELFDLSQKYLMQTAQGLAWVSFKSVTCAPDLLIRVQDTPSLFNKAKYERLEILQDVFAVDQSLLPSSESLVLVLDDISASGSTFMEIFKTMNQSAFQGELVFISLCA